MIGGVFALERAAARVVPPALLATDCVMLASASGAYALLLEWLRPPRAWLPAYICETVVAAVSAHTEACFYPVGERLDDAPAIGVRPGDAVVVVDYYGWLPRPEGIAGLREAGAVVIEDASQALLTEGTGTIGDFWIASPRKFVGVPDGGLLGPRPDGMAVPAEPVPEAWWRQAREARVGRRAFDENGGDRSWFPLFQRAEDGVPARPYAMSELSRSILAEGIDADAIAARRQANYDVLQRELGEVSLMGPRPDGVVPMGFPVRVAERDAVSERLFADRVFPPVHWPIPDPVPASFAADRRLSSEVMTLPCDQCYDERDMLRVARLICDGSAAKRPGRPRRPA